MVTFCLLLHSETNGDNDGGFESEIQIQLLSYGALCTGLRESRSHARTVHGVKSMVRMEEWHAHLYTMGTATREVGEVDTAAEVRAMADRSMSTSGAKKQPIDG